MASGKPGCHLDDHELLLLLDEQAGSGEEVRLRGHVADCVDCAARFVALADDAAVVSAWLAKLPLPNPPRRPDSPVPRARAVPTRHPQRTWLRAAAVIIAAVGVTGAVRPVRARIAAWLTRGWTDLIDARTTQHQARAAAERGSVPTSAVVWFVPAGPDLPIRLAGRQTAGALLIERGEGASAALEIAPSDPAVVALASSDGLALNNPPSARSSYRLQIPPGVRQVIVYIGREPPRVLGGGNLASPMRFDLVEHRVR
ncbi:MAG TPA: hypothetical protein VFQ38_07485 [Longimicrobiales bacterium]|nr:hypothetical protein [Longimicrobiales bacterium]